MRIKTDFMRIRTDYSEIIEELIENYGSAAEVVEHTGISKTTLYDIRKGAVIPNMETYIKMMEGLEGD